MNINSYRKFLRNDNQPNEDGSYVLYWMQVNRRFEYNYALDYAVAWANKLEKPLLVFEDVSCDYPWASDRFHTFMMQGMNEHVAVAEKGLFNYYPYVEEEADNAFQTIVRLASSAALLISDEYPVHQPKERNAELESSVDIPFITVDSNGIIPLGFSNKDFYSAFFFRQTMQKQFVEAFTNPPKENSLADLRNKECISLVAIDEEQRTQSISKLSDITDGVASLPIDHTVKPLKESGTREAALKRLEEFVQNDLGEYGERRNDPDAEKTSRLSGWLHFGKISEYEIVKAALDKQPENWSIDQLHPNGGKRSGFFKGNESIESFLDEVVTWREVGFHFAHHRPDYDKFESLPEWALTTMQEHEATPRMWSYTLEELEYSKTHDELWNAAQNQLREDGIIHNYLRMLWGKKVIEWTPDHRTALQYLIHLNNKYAIDGCDPNSYSGIFWCFGRFDRAWQERAVFGKLRYMSSDNTRKKVKLNGYLAKFGN